MPDTINDVFECSEERGGCGRTFRTYEEFADHECAPDSTPALSMLVEHGLKANAQAASCKCGAWDFRTNEVIDSEIRRNASTPILTSR